MYIALCYELRCWYDGQKTDVKSTSSKHSLCKPLMPRLDCKFKSPRYSYQTTADRLQFHDQKRPSTYPARTRPEKSRSAIAYNGKDGSR